MSYLKVMVFFAALALVHGKAMAAGGDNSGFGASLFTGQPPPALEDVAASGTVTDADLNTIAPAAGPEGADMENATHAGEGDSAAPDQRPHEDNPDLVWP